MKAQDSLKTIVQALPPRLRFEVGAAAQKRLNTLQEIRLRIGCSPMLVTTEGTYYCADVIERRDITELISALCSYSVYAKQNEILNGYITLRGGSRAGLCGTAVYTGSSLINIRDPSSVVLRIACERRGCAALLLSKVNLLSGVLICGSPCSGKTTILRELARVLSEKYRVSVIDTRGEIAAVYAGSPQNDVGRADILDCYPRDLGFDHAVRCLSPDIVICDEIGCSDDLSAIANASLCGVAAIASAHAENKAELARKPYFRELCRKKAFNTFVFLQGRSRVGELGEVCALDELC